MKILIATIRSWNIDNAKLFIERYGRKNEINLISKKDDLTLDYVKKYNPDYIFFPHWSYIIPQNIYESFECVVFHMADLPYGRGGSPLQNLIVRGHKETVISAIRVEKGLDAGPIYFKEPLSLDGTADDIFRRASDIIFNNMIPCFLNDRIEPKEQEGEVTVFRRRTRDDGEIKSNMNQAEIFNYIRMLDAEGYPNAFIPFGDWVLEFSNALIEGDSIKAKVIFRRIDNE